MIKRLSLRLQKRFERLSESKSHKSVVFDQVSLSLIPNPEPCHEPSTCRPNTGRLFPCPILLSNYVEKIYSIGLKRIADNH